MAEEVERFFSSKNLGLDTPDIKESNSDSEKEYFEYLNAPIEEIDDSNIRRQRGQEQDSVRDSFAHVVI